MQSMYMLPAVLTLMLATISQTYVGPCPRLVTYLLHYNICAVY